MRKHYITLDEALELDKHIDPGHMALWEAEARAEDKERTIRQWMREKNETYAHMEVIYEQVCGKHAHDYDYLDDDNDDVYDMDVCEERGYYGTPAYHIPRYDGIAGGHEMW